MEFSLLLLLWLLLPVAAGSGWVAARRSFSVKAETTCRRWSSDYLQGLNYLLNEQPDKAIDVFLTLIDVDHETIETHLALGAMFRRRGEVNRAIRIHQNLVARPNLNLKQYRLALLELAQDYQRAGLLDRAENLYQELIAADRYSFYAYRQLLDIYQQEHEWEKAINAAEKLAEVSGENLNPVIAQYYCEQAEHYRRLEETEKMRFALRQALQTDVACVRASLLESRLALEVQEWESAIRALLRVEQQDPAYLPEIIDDLQICYRQVNRLEELRLHLQRILQRYGGATPLLSLAALIREQQGEEAATEFVIHHLQEYPSIRGLAHFIDIALSRAENVAQQNLLLLKDIIARLLKNKPLYQCKECGFNGKTLYWQCPSCKQWNTVKPIQGMEGE